MAMENNVVPCPVCGMTMNHHADKLVYVCEGGSAIGVNEVVEEFYRCPNCGAGSSSPVALGFNS